MSPTTLGADCLTETPNPDGHTSDAGCTNQSAGLPGTTVRDQLTVVRPGYTHQESGGVVTYLDGDHAAEFDFIRRQVVREFVAVADYTDPAALADVGCGVDGLWSWQWVSDNQRAGGEPNNAFFASAGHALGRWSPPDIYLVDMALYSSSMTLSSDPVVSGVHVVRGLLQLNPSPTANVAERITVGQSSGGIMGHGLLSSPTPGILPLLAGHIYGVIADNLNLPNNYGAVSSVGSVDFTRWQSRTIAILTVSVHFP